MAAPITLSRKAEGYGTGALESRAILYPAAALSLAAAAGHLWAAPEHSEAWAGYGLFFLLLAFLQGAYGLVLLRRPGRPLLLAGIAGNLAVVGFYVATRTAGVPLFGPHAGETEPFGALDLTVTAAELALVAALVVLARALPAARTYLVLGSAQAFGVGALLHFLYRPMHPTGGTAEALHWLSYSALALPFSVLVVWLATPLARRLVGLFGGETGAAPRLAWSLVAAAAYAGASVPSNGLAVRHTEIGAFLAQGVRDAGVVLGATFILLFAVSMLRGAPWETPRKIDLWRPRTVAATAGIAVALAVVAGPALFGQAFSKTATAQQAPAAPASDCSAASYDRSYDVAAVNVDIPYNRWGNVDPHGQAYVLQGDKEATKNWYKPLDEAKPVDDPSNRRLRPRPLVIRANAGECVKVDFTNELNDVGGGGLPNNPRASMKVFGPAYDAQTSDGSAVGYNEDTTVPNKDNPGTPRDERKISYYWQAPAEEGIFHFRDQGATAGSEANSGSLSHGLYGAFAVEPPGSAWNDPETGQPIYAGQKDHDRVTKHSGDPYIDADIVPPADKAFRETVQISQDELPGGFGFGFNYGAEPQKNREAERGPDSIGEETSLSSWVYGDPALIKLASGQGPWKPDADNKSAEDCGLEKQPGGSCYVSNVVRSYPKDPTKIRFSHAGVTETHVFHMHAHQWRGEPNDNESETIDSQTWGPGESFTADLIGGAGSKPGTFGDSIFHCHLYPHFADGFWSLFRVHDVKEDGTNKTPDGINVRNLESLPDRTPEEGATADNPGYPRFIPGENGWRAPQAPGSVSETTDTADDPGTVEREDLAPATRMTAGKLLDPAKLDAADPLQKRLADRLAVEKKVQTRNAGPNPNPGAPFTEPCPTGSREVTYNVSVIQTPITYNERGDQDTQGRMLVLDKDADDVLAGRKEPEPLFVRVNAGDCINWNLTNRLPNYVGNDAFLKLAQTNMMGQHIHLVKFDVLGSDGSSNGWNYQQAAFTREQSDFNKKVAAGDETCNETQGCRLPNPADFDPKTRSGPAPGQTISERWYADTELKTVFTHDHHFPAVDQNRGLFGGMVVEPEGMDSRNPKTGEFYQPGNGSVPGAKSCGAECEGDAAGTAMDIIGPGQKDDFREFGLAAQDFVPLTRAEGNPQNPADVINPPAAPEAFPDADPGTMAVNYKNAPFDLRQERDGAKTDPAYAFSSTVHGDPKTPVLDTYSEDPVRIRAIQGSQEEQHVFKFNGMRWREEPDDPNSPLVSSQDIGVSEAFNFQVPKIDCGAGASDCSGDYLYSSTSVDDMYTGMWGLLRARANEVPSLLPLPDNVPATKTAEERAPSATAPPPSTSPGTPCAPGAPTKRYNIVAMEAKLDYNKDGDNDPYGLIYALAEDEAAIRSGDKKAEPLVLRANEGDCIDARLTNKLTPGFLDHNGIADGDAEVPTEPETGTKAGLRVSLNPQLVKYDVRGSDGTAVGYNRDQTVGPGESKLYRWYADDVSPGELGTTNLADYGDVRGHRHHGLFAGLNIEPRGATYRDPETGEEIDSGASADIRVPGPGNDFRENTLFYQDGLNLRDRTGALIEPPPEPGGALGGILEGAPAEDAEDQGEKGFNYTNAPFKNRIGEMPETGMEGEKLANVFNSRVHGDPDTPIFRAYAGDDVRMRVLQGADKPRQNTFQASGHAWKAQPEDPGSNLIGNQGGISVGRAFNAELSSAGGGFPGDYLYGTGINGDQLSGGLWGLMRVYPQPAKGALDPTPIGPTDNPRAGGHPLLPLEISATATNLDLKAAPAALLPNQATTLSGRLSSGGTSLGGKDVTIQRSAAGSGKWEPVPGGNFTTNADGGFRLAGVKAGVNTDYRALFSGQAGRGLEPSTSSIVGVKVKQATNLSLAPASSPLTFGQPTVLTGRLISRAEGVAGKRVTLLHKPIGAASYTRVPGQPSAGVLTNANGFYRLAGVKPSKNTLYRARFGGGPEHQLSYSPIRRVNVKAVITNATPTQNLKLGNSRAILGLVKPGHTGPVKVTIKRGTRIVATRNVALRGSRYRVMYRPPAPGIYTVQAFTAPHADHFVGASPIKKLRVVR